MGVVTPHTPAAVCDTTQFTEQLPELLPSLRNLPCIAVSSTSKQCCDAIANTVGSDEEASLPACLCNRDAFALTEQLLEDTFGMELNDRLTARDTYASQRNNLPCECEVVDFASKTIRVSGRRQRRRRVSEDDTWVRERSRRNTGRA